MFGVKHPHFFNFPILNWVCLIGYPQISWWNLSDIPFIYDIYGNSMRIWFPYPIWTHSHWFWRLHDHDDMLKCGSLGPLNGMLNGMLNVFQGDWKWHDWWVYLLENCNRHQRPHLEITMAGIHPFVFHEQHLLSRMIWFGLISVENRNHSFWARVSASLQPLHVKHMRSRHGEINVAWNGPLAQNTSYISLHDSYHRIGVKICCRHQKHCHSSR